ncbi:hypothetical protein [Marinactinospora rubrisoli]|uniref:Uncharacterized protein n=1 Tax=Marinactinospora rubrisoli TaxID=2715399 RepID=A0ABW2KGS8_9ACTN
MLVCATEDCYQRIGGGGSRGIAVLNRAVLLSPRGTTPEIAAHELTHVELAARLGRAGEVPQWFDEGVAVLVSEDPRYLRPAGTADRCLTETTGPLPETLQEWLTAADADPGVYAAAACRVHRWVEANGGHDAVRDLTGRLAAGERFGDIVPG